MKKLLVVLAVLFASVGSMYAVVEPITATGYVTVKVSCPITVVGNETVAFENVILGGLYDTPAEITPLVPSGNPGGINVDFGVLGCGSQLTAGVNNLISMTVSLGAKIEKTTTSNVVVDGKWYYLDNSETPAPVEFTGTIASPTASVPFDGSLSVYYQVQKIDAQTQHTMLTTPDSWTLTLSVTQGW